MLKKSALMLLLVASTAASYASSTHSASIDIQQAVQAGSVSIPPGHYTLHWAADSGDTDLSLTEGKKRQFTVPVTINSGPAVGGEQVLTRQDGTATALEGFKIKELVLKVR
jgi:hypothetical protein